MKFKSWWIIISLLQIFFNFSHQQKCLKQDEAFTRHFYVNEHELPFRIQVSKRETHQLVSEIFKTFLIEVLGYKDVHLVNSNLTIENPTGVLQKITNCETPTICNKTGGQGPEVMINLEVWLVPGFNMEGWISTEELEDCGPLGPVGTSGWFIPSFAVETVWTSNRTVLDHWRAFKDPTITAQFDLNRSYDNIYSYTINPETDQPYCTYDECDENGVYHPPQCKNVNCATLLADYPDATYSILKNEVSRLGLLVNIAWVGKSMETIVNDRTEVKNFTVFFHKKPSILATLGNFHTVSFPDCEDNSDDACNFHVYQLEKIAWSKIKSNAPHVFDLMRAFTFSQDTYTKLLDEYSRGKLRGFTYEYVACRWIDENRLLWTNWIPKGLDEKIPLYIGGIFPVSGPYWRQSGVITAANLAVKAVNSKATLLSDYSLTLLEQDGHCVADEVMKSFINYVTNGTYKSMVGILGPACTDTVEPIAGLAKHFNTIIISYSAEGSLFNNREKYPYFFRTIPENNQFRFVYLKLFQHFKWNRVAALTEDGQKYPEYVSHLQDLFQSNDMTFIANRKFPRERTSHDMKPYLQDLKDKNARIIIGDFYDYAARSVMCAAYKLGMTSLNGYQWFLPLWFSSDWFDTDRYNAMASEPHERVSCTTREMIEAINGHLSLTYKFYADSDYIMQEDRTVGEWKKTYHQKIADEEREFSQYGGYAYDAVWVFATALDTLLKENNSHLATLHTVKTSKRLVELLNETSINGVSGLVESIGVSRLSEVVIWQWRNSSKRQVGFYKPVSHVDGELELNESHIKWMTANGQKPGDGSVGANKCAVEVLRKALGVTCELAVGIINIIAFSFIIIFMFLGFVYFKRRYEKRMRKTEARIKELGLEDISRVDEWEMRKDHIIMNRKLGEGAFGTVFGGEAFSKNEEWIAVAVKRLKPDAKPEEKLDFLSEAEVMKKFDHINIVQLIGVCTMGEPVFTIMEFMLYGDLKTYLLGRRNLVTEPNRDENDEVSDRRLTNMALDIARGLSYLADLKFVHRDLASRNCLVNANRLVKIGDFGMCRLMYDSDYYRFNKKGMLPVRWMAPESLKDGIFTPMSDVWSYGVVLYEIVTFGSFPYQGMSNNQVLEHVKSYKKLSVPKACKTELEVLLNNCWNREPGARPSATEIVEVLVNHPELISPCLDMPIASVEPDDSNSLNVVSIHDRPRVHSASSIWRSRRHFASGRFAHNRINNQTSSNNNNREDGSASYDLASPTTNHYKLHHLYMLGRKSVPKDQKLSSYATSETTHSTRL